MEPNWTTEVNRLGCFAGVWRAALYSDWIIAISKASKEHFLQIFPWFPKDRISVVYPCSRFTNLQELGSQPAVISKNKIEPGKFWLSVGTIEPRKNQKMLVKAYAQYVANTKDPMPLIFAGKNGWLMDDFPTYINSLGFKDQIFITGFVTDAELIWLYRNCFANLYPSFFEGFGLPVLEGMQFNAATIASNTTSLPEITSAAALSLNPKDCQAWTDAMCALVDDPSKRQELSVKGKIRAGQFSWSNSALAVLDVYDRVEALGKRILND